MTGMKRIMAGMASMKVPTKRKKAMRMSMNISGLPTWAAKNPATCSDAL